MNLTPRVRAFYTEPSTMTALGARATAFDDLPQDLAGLCSAVQGVLLHEHWAQAYGQSLAPERRAQSHLRSTGQMLAQTFAIDSRPLSETRPPERRTIGVCRHFSVLLVAMLRHHGIPARARCGFGAYFEPGKFVDHWVAEVWDGTRWKLVDAQIDHLQRRKLQLDMDLHDVPRDHFVIAFDAWQRCRAGRADPEAFGIFDMHGLWFIAGNLLRDAAALNNMEMLPWDVWGAMKEPGEPMDAETLAFFDSVARITGDPDTHFAELRAAYEDPRLRVPSVVFNAVAQRRDAI